jgi:hypothetical protein
MDIQSIAKSLGLDKIDAGNLGMSQEQLKGEADRMWRMLDEMSESDPEAYKKFIAGQMEQNKPLTEKVKAHSIQSAGAIEVKPNPGFVFVTCVKGEDSLKKPLFINYVHSKEVDPPVFVRDAPSLEQELHRTRVPLWLSKKLPLPKGGHFIDVLVHSDNITRAAAQPEYRMYLLELGIVAAEQEFKFLISRAVQPVGNPYVGASAAGPASFIVRLAAADAAAAAAAKAADANLMSSIASDKKSAASDITLEQLLAARRGGGSAAEEPGAMQAHVAPPAPAAAAPLARPLIQEISSSPAVAAPKHTLKRVLGGESGAKKTLVLEVLLPGVASVRRRAVVAVIVDDAVVAVAVAVVDVVVVLAGPKSLLPQMNAVELDVSCSSVALCVDGKYELTLTLPELVDQDAASAKFSKGSSSLTLTMPCLC